MPASKVSKSELENDVYVLKLSPQEIALKYSYQGISSVWRALKYRGIPYPHFHIGAKELSETQRQFIMGTLLGDGHITPISPHLRVSQCFEQEEYVDWKFNLIKDWVRPSGVYYEQSNKLNGKHFIQIRFDTYSHPEFKFYRNLFYPDGVKIIPDQVLSELQPFGIAVWFMDDGSYMKEKGNVRIHTAGFTIQDNEKLVEWFASKFGIVCHLGKISRGYPVLTFYSKEADKFIDLVKPYIIPSMLYKIGC